MKYRVAVRALCEFTGKRGDLDSRFTPSTSAFEGISGHRLIGLRRGAAYEREVTLQGEHQELAVRGRADGYDAVLNRLEEYKTYRGDLARMADNHRSLHWAQLKTYGALLCRQRALTEIELALVYFDVKTEEETSLRVRYDANVLNLEFMIRCEDFLAWAREEIRHRRRRDEFLTAISFPHADLRSTQRHLAESVYKAARTQATLMAQAPTGIGKTIGTLFPLLKAVPKQRLDKIFFLAAKGSGRAAALETLKMLVGEPTPDLRILEYTSRESACEYPGRACNGQSCPLAKGFYDRLPRARLAAADKGMWDQPSIRAVALSERVCPYYLTQELARWSDVIVGDYNYYFDVRASLFGLTNENQWRVALLVDEAHNLLPRAREMYSATLGPEEMEAAWQVAPPHIRRLLDRLKHAWGCIPFPDESPYCVLPAIPDPLLAAIAAACAAILDHLADDPESPGATLQEFFFSLLQFSRLAESFDKNSLFEAVMTPFDSSPFHAGARDCSQPLISIRNIIPAPFLAARFSASVTSILFSATLAPETYYRQLLGLPAGTLWIDVESPFRAEQLVVRIARNLSTRYSDRAASIAPIVHLLERQYRARPGNYLAFFSSFEYLEQALMAFRNLHPQIQAWEQLRRMDAAARELFLSRFSVQGSGIGFAVLGGIFAEGIDLPGDRLIGAFIATLGLPQLNPFNNHMQQRMQEQFGAGYEYAYLYPGLQKVIQAAGRVIRTTVDTGTIHLMDDRFAQPAVRSLLPAWWQIECA